MQCTSGCTRITVGVLVVIGCICLIFVVLAQRYCNRAEPPTDSILSPRDSSGNTNDPEGVAFMNDMNQLIDKQREIIRKEMEGYPYPNGKYNISATKFEDLVIEQGGKPIRSVILSTFRSGSSFLGEVISAHPGNFYHFEPLSGLNVTQVRGPPFSGQAVKNLKALLNCEYAEQDDMYNNVKFEIAYPFLFNRSTNLWPQCRDYGDNMCYDVRYLTRFCKLFPFQSMKLTRLRLNIAQQLLDDEKLAVRLVLLVRDPRAIMRSRKNLFFSNFTPDVSEPALLCADSVLDYKAAVVMQKKYPSTFRVLRYEDLATDTYNQVEELSKFFGRDFHANVKTFLDTHTKTQTGGAFATTRNTKKTPYHWRTDLSFEEVDEIQQVCEAAMEYWGYVPAMNLTHQREFNPVTDYDLNL